MCIRVAITFIFIKIVLEQSNPLVFIRDTMVFQNKQLSIKITWKFKNCGGGVIKLIPNIQTTKQNVFYLSATVYVNNLQAF